MIAKEKEKDIQQGEVKECKKSFDDLAENIAIRIERGAGEEQRFDMLTRLFAQKSLRIMMKTSLGDMLQ